MHIHLFPLITWVLFIHSFIFKRWTILIAHYLKVIFTHNSYKCWIEKEFIQEKDCEYFLYILYFFKTFFAQ